VTTPDSTPQHATPDDTPDQPTQADTPRRPTPADTPRHPTPADMPDHPTPAAPSATPPVTPPVTPPASGPMTPSVTTPADTSVVGPEGAPDGTPQHPTPDDMPDHPTPAPSPTPSPTPPPVAPPAAEPAPEPAAEPAAERAAEPAAERGDTRPETPPEHPSETPQPPASDWGRVSEDGTVFVRTAEGERPVGQMPDASPAEALAFFTKRYDDLAFEVDLLEQRVKAGALNPEEAAASVKQVRGSVHGAQAVGDLAGLEARLDALTGTIDAQREKRRKERARKLERAKVEKERIAGDAERLSQGSDWRDGANRMRQLLDEWKALPRLEKSVDDALWRRFSTARTTYTRRRKTHFAELNEKRDAARAAKEKLVVEAEALAESTDWGATAGRYRDLMRQWKAAGPAPKGIDDQLWKRFRAAQDTFFGARDNANAELDREFSENAKQKEALLAEAEALLPVTDLRAAKEAFRSIAERWDAAGKVPRDRMKDLEGRMRTVEQAIRGAEDDRWRRSNPEARARAADTVAQLESSLADLQVRHEKALSTGDARKAAEHAAAIETRRSWLAEARRALDEFSG
jgi:hypothetical protein